MIGSKKSGIAIIDENVAKFQNIIDGLDKGICLCEDEITANEIQIKSLAESNSKIESSKSVAVNFKGNLSKMLETPVEEKKD
jgi:hypothetical protein